MNRRPSACKADALPTELYPRKIEETGTTNQHQDQIWTSISHNALQPCRADQYCDSLFRWQWQQSRLGPANKGPWPCGESAPPIRSAQHCDRSPIGRLCLSDGTVVLAPNVARSRWSAHLGRPVTVTSRVARADRDGDPRFELVGWHTIESGSTSR